MLAFVLEHLPKDFNTWLVADIFDLLGVLGDVLGFVQFQTTERHVDATDAIGKVIGFTGFRPIITERHASQGAVAASPKIGVSLFGIGKSTKSLAPLQVRFPFCQSGVGFSPTHLGLPVTF